MGFLLIKNFILFLDGDNKFIIHIIIQFILVVLILSNNNYIKLCLKLWSGLFLILAPVVQLITKSMKFSIVGSQNEDMTMILQTIVTIIIGVLIFYYSDKTIEIKSNIEKPDGSDI